MPAAPHTPRDVIMIHIVTTAKCIDRKAGVAVRRGIDRAK